MGLESAREQSIFQKIEVPVNTVAGKLCQDNYYYHINVFKNIFVHVSKSCNSTINIRSL